MGEDAIKEITRNCLLTRTRRIARVLTGMYDHEMRPFGINSPQFTLLVLISRLGPVSRAEIGRRNHQERSTLTRNLQLMLSEGWVEEIQQEAGGRSRPIVLTSAGRELLHRATPAWRAAQAQAKRLLGEAGVNAVMDIANELPQQGP
ncbi:MarR family winged helix-turn-helix transcriptional regulator [Pendulispora rubella]|uniref:MarR family winged helix-turn-helix transcriptional regulator n=1 Tax=Pendulispora rubella TaxID=2741070 RepID=A0ABZ2LAN5_9BACT